MKSLSIFIILSGGFLLSPILAVADDQARQIAQRAYDRDDGKDSWAEIEMTLHESGGNDRVRTLISASKDYGELSKRYIRFKSPQAIEGTSFLSLEKHEDSDDQFLYLPSLHRVRRIASDQKDRSFVNTDFTYEDMERRKVERDNFSLGGSESVLGHDCWILERTPKDKDDSQYSKVKSWVAKDNYVVLKAEMYNKKGTLSKVFEAQEIKNIDGIWTLTQVSMKNLEEDHATSNKILSVKYNKGVSDDVFTEAYLERKG